MTNQEQYDEIWEKANKYDHMTEFEKWCEDKGIDQLSLMMKVAFICMIHTDCIGCPLRGFENCYIDNPDVVKWFEGDIKHD